LPVRIRAGLPIDLLRRRPDIVEAERQLASATAQIGVATADLFPQVALTASAGRQTGVAPLLISPIWSVGPAFAVPILDFGRLDAVVERADYHSRELLFAYKQTVLDAVRQVDTAIDCGFYANPERIRSQIEGAAVMGLSLAKYGEITLKNGRVEQSNFNDYPVVRHDESPTVTNTHIVENSIDVPSSGVGEPGVPPFAPALCNAIFAATGKRIRRLPIGNQLA